MSTGTPNQSMSDADKADLYYKLAERARLRFESFRTVYWKATFGLWTLFAVGAAFVFASDGPLTCPELVVANVFVGAVVLFYVFQWLPYSLEIFQRDNRVSYWWETHIQRVLDKQKSIPDQLKPGQWKLSQGPSVLASVLRSLGKWLRKPDDERKPDDAWHSAYDLDKDKEEIDWNRRIKVSRWHRAQVLDTVITLILALLFVSTFWGKWLYHPTPIKPASKMTVEQGSLEIEGPAKLLLGPKASEQSAQ